MGSRRSSLVKSCAFGGGLSQAVALESEPVGVVDEPVEDGVGDRRIADRFMPMLDRELAGHDRRTASVAVVDDLQQVAALIRRQVGQPPVVEDQQLRARDALEQPGVAAITACERQGIEQPWHAMVEHRAIVTAGLVCEWTSPAKVEGFSDRFQESEEQ